MHAWIFPAIWGVAMAAFLIRALLVRGNDPAERRTHRHFLWAGVLFSAVGLAISLVWTYIIQTSWMTLIGVIIVWIALGAIALLWPRVTISVMASIVLAALVLVPAVPAVAADYGWHLPGISSEHEETPAPEPTEELAVDEADVPDTYPQRYLDILRDNGYELEEVEDQTIPVFVAKSTKYEEKLWVDAVCLPVADRDAVLAMVLGSPDCAAQVASGLYRLPIIGLDGKTTSLGEISPWLAEWSDPSTLNDWAQSAMDSEGADRIEYARKLVLIAIQLERFSDGGVEKRETAYNFHAVVDGTNGTLAVDESNPWGTVPEFELSPRQYKGDFVIFRVTYKGYEGCWAEFGVNTGDGRFAGFTCETPTPEVTPEAEDDNPGPEQKYCTAPDGSTHPVGSEVCNPPGNTYCVAPDGTQYPEGDERCNPPVIDLCEIPGKEHLPAGDPGCKEEPAVCPWDPSLPEDDPNCLKDKDADDNTEEPEGVTQEPLDPSDPVETEEPVVTNPSDGTEEQGDSSSEVTVDDPDTSVSEPEGPPAGEGETPSSPEDPETEEIVDPDAASAAMGFGLLPFVLLAMRRRLAAAVEALRGE